MSVMARVFLWSDSGVDIVSLLRLSESCRGQAMCRVLPGLSTLVEQDTSIVPFLSPEHDLTATSPYGSP